MLQIFESIYENESDDILAIGNDDLLYNEKIIRKKVMIFLLFLKMFWVHTNGHNASNSVSRRIY